MTHRLSFMRFLGLGLEGRVPDAKTVWLYREQLTQRANLTGPEVRRRAGFQADQAGRKITQKIQHGGPAKFLAKDNLAIPINTISRRAEDHAENPARRTGEVSCER